MAKEQFPVTKTDEEWRRQLTPEQYAVLRGHGTEFPGSCALLTEHREGTFACAACDQPLFVADTEVRERNGLAQLLRADRGLDRHHRRSQSWNDAHRSALQPVRRTSGPRLSRRSTADRIALLHQRRGAELQSQGHLSPRGWNPGNQRLSSRGAAGRMLAIAAKLDLVTRLLAVVAAVLPERSLWLDGAIAGRVGTFRRSSHVDPPMGRIYASSHRGTRRRRHRWMS